MIKTEKDYLEAKSRLTQERKSLEQHETKMKAAGMTAEQIKIAMDPLISFTVQLKEEVAEYEKLKRGQFDPLVNLDGLGRTLIALRIYKGISQRDLADKLGVSEPQVSRDERNEYHGASIEKVQRVLDALNVKIESKLADIRNAV